MSDDAGRDLLRKTGTLPGIAVDQATAPQVEILKQLLEIGKTLGRQDHQLDQILGQVVRTNGRVTELEERRSEDDLRQSMELARGDAVKAEHERLKKPIKIAASLAKFVGLGSPGNLLSG